MPLIARIFWLLAFACATPLHAATLTATPATLAAAVASAQGGDTIVVASAAPAAIVIRNRVFAPPLTIASADPAHPAEINGFDFLGSTGLRLVNLDIHETNPVSAQSPVLNIVGSSDVRVSGSIIRGTRDPATGLLMGKGVVVTGGSGFILVNSEVRDLFKGVSLADATNPSILGNDLHNIRTSPVDGGGLLVAPHIIDNHIHDIVPDRTQGDHSDGIHLFTKSGSPITGALISGNVMVSGPDASGTLGINLEGTPSPGGFVDVHVVGNTLRWNNNQGITTNYVVSGEISANVLTPAPGLDNPAHAPAIIFRNSGPDVKVTGNTAKLGPSMKPFAAGNTFLTAAQIAAMGAPAPPSSDHP